MSKSLRNEEMEKKIQEISEKTGISAYDLKKHLGIPLEENPATTIEEVKKAYEKAAGDEAKRIVLDKWISLASTLKEIIEVYFLTPGGIGSILRIAAKNKWNEFILREVEKISTVEEAREINSYNYHELEAHKLVLDKWNKFLLPEVEKASTVEEIKEVYDRSPVPSIENEAAKAALYKWIALASTVEEVKEVYKKSPGGDNKIRKTALDKWDELSLEEVKKAITVEEVKKVHDKARIGSEARKAALDKWIALASTVEEVRGAYLNISGVGDKARKEITLNKWIALASTIEEINEVQKVALGFSLEMRKIALDKILNFFSISKTSLA